MTGVQRVESPGMINIVSGHEHVPSNGIGRETSRRRPVISRLCSVCAVQRRRHVCRTRHAVAHKITHVGVGSPPASAREVAVSRRMQSAGVDPERTAAQRTSMSRPVARPLGMWRMRFPVTHRISRRRARSDGGCTVIAMSAAPTRDGGRSIVGAWETPRTRPPPPCVSASRRPSSRMSVAPGFFRTLPEGAQATSLSASVIAAMAGAVSERTMASMTGAATPLPTIFTCSLRQQSGEKRNGTLGPLAGLRS